MYIDSLSGLELLVALDARNIEAHLAGVVENCAACATVSGSRADCPADRAIAMADAASYRKTAAGIIDQLTAPGCRCRPWHLHGPLHARQQDTTAATTYEPGDER